MIKILFTLWLIVPWINLVEYESIENSTFSELNPIINLNGIWKINLDPSGNFWKEEILNEEWKDIQVPGECMMQGFPIKHDQPFVYKKHIEIPLDFVGKEIKLRFEGVYSYARVWINGNFLRDHSGGFTQWDCNITPFVKPGERAMLTVEVTDKADDISYGSGYAKHQIGGILRDVKLLALPTNYPDNISIITDFDSKYKNAALHIRGDFKRKVKNAKIQIELRNKENKKITLQKSSVELNGNDSFNIENTVQSPNKWDAEHPDLYQLTVNYFEKDQLIFQKIYQVGFREIEVRGNKLLVNGKEVKLRGACRHDIHPLLGRVSTPEFELKDVKLAKEANMNFIRTSHYPPTENFLRLCDEYGLYVEDETAVCFVGSHRTEEYAPGASEGDPNYRGKYLSQLEEMVNNHKNHPSVIIWSIGNENSYGENFKKSYDWVKENDKTRPVIFSYPGNVPENEKSYDILSMHYPDITGNLSQHDMVTKDFGYKEMPVIFDEWAHVACYNNFTVKEDPNIRDFWGQSLDRMWSNVFEADGGLGGAIWGMIDETFMLPRSLPGFNEWWGKIDKKVIPAEYTGNTIGYGEWGIVDTWRRKKPEFWNTKKAYSPVKFLQTTFENYSGRNLSVPVYNRFDHTNINELTIKYSYQGYNEILKPTDIQPHSRGVLDFPIKNLKQQDPVTVEIFDNRNRLIDKYILHLKVDFNIPKGNDSYGEISVKDEKDQLTVNCKNNTKIIFNKRTGLIREIQNSTTRTNFSGPYLNLRTKGDSKMYSNHEIDDHGENWSLMKFTFKRENNEVVILTKGKYEDVKKVDFEMRIISTGEITIRYQIKNIPKSDIREIGIRFELDNIIDSLSWLRNPYWSYYPEEHLSAQKGNVSLYSNILKKYRIEPTKEWENDSKSFYYEGTKDESFGDQLTNISRSTKENIMTYNLYNKGREILSVLGQRDIACRIEKRENSIQLFANNKMDYIDLSWGNFQRNIVLNKMYSDKVVFKINTD